MLWTLMRRLLALAVGVLTLTPLQASAAGADGAELEGALLELRGQLERHMASKNRSFRAEVARKRARQLGVTALIGADDEGGRDAAV